MTNSKMFGTPLALQDVENLYQFDENRAIIERMMDSLPQTTTFAIHLLRLCRLAFIKQGNFRNTIPTYEISNLLINVGISEEISDAIGQALLPLAEMIDCAFLENLELRLCRAVILRQSG